MNVRRLVRIAPALAVLAVLVGLWEFVTRLAAVPEWLLPSPTVIVVEFFESLPQLAPHTTRTRCWKRPSAMARPCCWRSWWPP